MGLPVSGDVPDDAIPSELVDLTTVNLAALDALDADSTLARSIARLLADAERPDEAVAGFNSSI